jgi:replication factor C subunit 1
MNVEKSNLKFNKCSTCDCKTILKQCINCLNQKIKSETNKESIASKTKSSCSLWVEKYAPNTIDKIIGNKLSISKAKNWIKNYKLKKDKTPPGLLIVGTPGIGKTSLAKILLNEFGYETVEFNASDIRNQKLVKENFKNIIGKISITSMMGVKRKIGIIMDEVDGMSSGDKGGMSELISFINPNKGLRKNKKKPLQYNNPIICISNEDFDKKINDLKKECEVLKFTKPKRSELYNLVCYICNEENLDLNDDTIFKIIDYSQLDIRKLICLLEYYSKNDKSDIEKFLNNIDKKNIHANLFDSTLKIITRKLSYEEIINMFDEFNLIINQTIHENLLNNYSNYKNQESQKLENLEKNYKSIMIGDLFEGRLYKDHIYEANGYIGYLTCVNISKNLNQLEQYQYLKNTDITYSKILSKFSIGLNNYKTKINYQKLLKLSNNLENSYLLFEIFLNYIFYDKEKFNKIYMENNINIEDVEKIAKIIKTLKNNSIIEKDLQINDIEKKKIKILMEIK